MDFTQSTYMGITFPSSGFVNVVGRKTHSWFFKYHEWILHNQHTWELHFPVVVSCSRMGGEDLAIFPMNGFCIYMGIY